jgi:hypothetical protein
MIDIISHTALLPFGRRIDEMETIQVPDDRQRRFVVIDPSSCPCSRLIILWKPLLLSIDLPKKHYSSHDPYRKNL